MIQSLRKKIKALFDKVVYQSAILNKLLRNINKALSGFTSFRIRPFGVLTVRLKSGLSFKMATNETSSVTKLLFWRGADNYEYSPIIEKLVRKCNNFIDIGANIGYYSLLASRANPTMRVYALEPASAPYHYLEKNIEINNLNERIKPFFLALSDKKGEIEFFELANPEKYHTQYNLAGSGSLKTEEIANKHFVSTHVRSETLDDFVLTNGLNPVDLLKIDTEGTENLILMGANNTLKSHRPIIICETLFKTIEGELERIMRQYGYQFYNHKNGKLIFTETLIREQDNGVRDCFFVHPDKVSWIKEFT